MSVNPVLNPIPLWKLMGIDMDVEARILSVLSTSGPLSMEDLAGYRPLLDVSLPQLSQSMGALLACDCITARTASIWYRLGDGDLRRDVTVFDIRRD